jgi:DedD protein
MAFFKFRQGGDNPSPTTQPAESIELMRRRARHRLIGAAVLVLIGVLGFPVLFDTQPRPMSVDVQIDIPDRNKLPPLQIPAPVTRAVTSNPPASVPTRSLVAAPVSPPLSAATERPVLTGEAKTEAKVEAEASLGPQEQLMAENSANNKAVAPAGRAVDATKKAVTAEAASTPTPTPALSPKPNASAQGEDHRYIIQVGAFADPVKARETRLKLEKAGLKTYTHVAETREGPRTRVRVGPFGTKAEADKVAAKVKALSLPSVILTL